MKKDREDQPNQTLAKALEVLDAFSASQPKRGVRELGRELGINPTTIYRIVATLANAGYLEQNEDDQTYTLGPKAMKLGALYAHLHPLPTVARKVFDSYSDRFEHNLYLGTLSRFEVIYLAVLDGRGPIKIAMEPGGSITLHSTALGKVLLAYQSEKYIHEFLAHSKLQTFTPRTVKNAEELISQLNDIREKGYAINDGEQYEDIGAIGVPVCTTKGKPVNLAVSLTYPRHLVYEKRINIMELIDLGREIAAEINRRYDVNPWS